MKNGFETSNIYTIRSTNGSYAINTSYGQLILGCMYAYYLLTYNRISLTLSLSLSFSLLPSLSLSL